MRKLILLIFFVAGWLSCFSQTDTVPPQYKTFEPFSSYLQFSMGYNIPVGIYSKRDEPFRKSYAATGYANLSVNAAYGQKINDVLNFTIGTQFIRAKFDYEKFSEGYLARYNDTLRRNNFNYEHIGLYAGVGYNYVKNKLNINFQGGVGALYTVLNMDDLIVYKGTNSSSHFNRGTFETGKSLRPMLYAGADIKYYIGYDTYLFANAFYTFSSFRQVITPAQ